MPWGLLTRLISGFFVYRVLKRGRPTGTPKPVDRAKLRRSVSRVREAAALAGRVIAAVVFALAGALAATAAVSLLTLGPRWLGVIVAIVTVIALGLAVIEAWSARKIVVQGRVRHRLELAPTDATDEAQS